MFPFGFSFNTRLSITSFYIGNRDGFPFLFFISQVCVLMHANLGPLVITMVFSLTIFLTGGDGGV